MNHSIRRLAVVLAVAGSLPITANAALLTSDFGTLIPGYLPNDDSTFAAINLPFTLNFFGTSYSTIFVNNNGNVTFGGSTFSFTPSPLDSQTTLPMIAPYWTDLDSRSDPLGSIAPETGGSGVYFREVSPTEVVVTWDRLGYYSSNYSGRAQFQLVLRDPSAALPAGIGDIGFYFGTVTSGTDGHNVTVGFGDGLGSVNPGELSLFAGLSSIVAPEVSGQTFQFNLEGGIPVVVGTAPEPGSLALLALGIGTLIGLRAKQRE